MPAAASARATSSPPPATPRKSSPSSASATPPSARRHPLAPRAVLPVIPSGEAYMSETRPFGKTGAALAALAALGLSSLAAGQPDAPGEPVTIAGATFSSWSVKEVRGRFGRPAGSPAKVPAVLILHGSGGVDGRGAFHATALHESGIATLEITMFATGGRPRAGHGATMPHAVAALGWLAARSDINAERLGVMGFSWGGVMTVLLSSELVQEQLGKD